MDVAPLGNPIREPVRPCPSPPGCENSGVFGGDAAGLGLFSLAGLQSPSASLGIEWEIALENLAFCCTYGRRNCLTSQMYAGELSLSKILSLVWGKLSEGTVRCA